MNTKDYNYISENFSISDESVGNRKSHLMVNINDDIYLYGGTNGTAFFKDLYKISKNPAGNYIVTQIDDNLTEIRDEFTNLFGVNFAVKNSDIYVFGGTNGANTFLNKLFKISTNPYSVSEISYTGTIPGRNGHSMIIINESLYIFGGVISGQNRTNNLYKIDLETTTVTATEILYGGDSISIRQNHYAVSIGNDMYICSGGGENGYVIDLYKINVIESYPTAEKITYIGDAIPDRINPSITAIGNDIYIYGGKNSDNNYYNDLYRISKNDNIYTSTRINYVGQNIPARYLHKMISINNDLFILGGDTGNSDNSDSYLYKISTKITLNQLNQLQNTNQYKFNLQSKYDLKISYIKDGGSYYFRHSTYSNLNSLIGYGLNLTSDGHLNNEYTGSGDSTTINIKFDIPCVGYLDNGKLFPESFLIDRTATDVGVEKNSYHIDNNVFIGSNLYVSDDITAFATYSTSDINLKKDIVNLDKCLDIIEKLNPVGFKWKKDDKDEVGFIAQEVEELIPEIVEEVNGYKVISESNIIAYLVGAIQELDKELRMLESVKGIKYH